MKKYTRNGFDWIVIFFSIFFFFSFLRFLVSFVKFTYISLRRNVLSTYDIPFPTNNIFTGRLITPQLM